MSKYEPLKRHLSQRGESGVSMTFRDVEEILGFRLPPSARNHPAWWSNNVGTHVNAAAWRDAGFRTSRVDIGGEKVTFVREPAPAVGGLPAEGVMEAGTPFAFAGLSKSALRMIEDCMEETGLDRLGAVAALLEASAAARRRVLLDAMPIARMPAGHDSTALIREDRDER